MSYIILSADGRRNTTNLPLVGFLFIRKKSKLVASYFEPHVEVLEICYSIKHTHFSIRTQRWGLSCIRGAKGHVVVTMLPLPPRLKQVRRWWEFQFCSPGNRCQDEDLSSLSARWLWKSLEQEWENEAGKGSKPRQTAIMSILLVRVTAAESHWGSLGVSVEHVSEFSYVRGDQAVLFIHQLPSPMVEGFFPIHQRHTIPTTYHTHTQTPQACPTCMLSI